jgi:hypothetical protein
VLPLDPTSIQSSNSYRLENIPGQFKVSSTLPLSLCSLPAASFTAIIVPMVTVCHCCLRMSGTAQLWTLILVFFCFARKNLKLEKFSVVEGVAIEPVRSRVCRWMAPWAAGAVATARTVWPRSVLQRSGQQNLHRNRTWLSL